MERFVPAADVSVCGLQLALILQAETVAYCKLTGASRVEYVRTTAELALASQGSSGSHETARTPAPEVILLKPQGDVTGLRRMGAKTSIGITGLHPGGNPYVKQYIRPKYTAPLAEGSRSVLMAALPGRLSLKNAWLVKDCWHR